MRKSKLTSDDLELVLLALAMMKAAHNTPRVECIIEQVQKLKRITTCHEERKKEYLLRTKRD